MMVRFTGSRLRVWFLLAGVLAIVAPAPGATDVREALSEARKAGDGERVAEIERSLGVELRSVGRPDETPYTWGFCEESSSQGERWALDVLVADQEDEEGRLEMVSTASGHLYLVIESMDEGNSCINIFRSNDGGATWYKWHWICPPPETDISYPAIAVPENAEDYIFLAYIHEWHYKVARITRATHEVTFTDLGGAQELHTPRMITDNVEWPGYYAYLFTTRGSGLCRTLDRGESWEQLPNPSWDMNLVSVDLAYADGHLYAVSSGSVGSRGDARFPVFTKLARSDSDGASWNPAQVVCEGLAGRVAAQRGAGRVAVVYEPWPPDDDSDVMYAYSLDHGDTWSADHCLSCLDIVDESAPEIAVGPGVDDAFHCAFLKTFPGDASIFYRGTVGAHPGIWSLDLHRVNDTGEASTSYAPPTLAVDWLSGAVGVAWADTRTPTLATYFDAVNRVLRVWPDGSGPFPYIQAAIDAAQPGWIIELGEGTYTGPGNLDLDFGGKGIVLRSGSESRDACIIDLQGSPSNQHRFIRFHSGEGRDAVVEGITVRNGYCWDGGAIACTDVPCSPTIRDCVFEFNRSTDDGGAIHISHGSAPLIENCVLRSNLADDLGGGVHCTASAPEIRSCLIEANAAMNDGAGLSFENGSGGELFECAVHGNVATDLAGGVMLRGSSSPAIRFCTFFDNWGLTDAGGLCMVDGDQVTLESCTFCLNGAPLGGGVSVYGGTCMLVQTIIAFSSPGAAVHCDGGQIQLGCCDLYGSAGGDYVDCAADYEGVAYNFSANPLFCDYAQGDVSLQEGSPCADQGGICGQVGALGIGCPASAVESPPEDAPPALALGVARNPGPGAVSLWFDLPAAQQATLRVFDVAGREVKVLADGAWSAGRRALVWDGRDGAGRQVPPGLYFLRIDAGGERATARAMFIPR